MGSSLVTTEDRKGKPRDEGMHFRPRGPPPPKIHKGHQRQNDNWGRFKSCDLIKFQMPEILGHGIRRKTPG